MELLNATGMQAGYTLGMDPSAREHLVVVVKGTFDLPEQGSEPKLSRDQVPLIEADTFTGEPGLSATIYESDYPLFKPRCDVLLHGSAHSSVPVERIRVRLRVGSIDKSIDVIGDRVWELGLFLIGPSNPKIFTKKSISYGCAFGGIDDSNEKKVEVYAANPIGVGFHKHREGKEIEGRPVPITEEPGRPIVGTTGKYRPMAFGPIGRSWPSRVKHAGTYDEHWMENVCPFLPKDFDPLYYQCAPEDQRMDHPRGGERVELVNLTPEGKTAFNLPNFEIPVEFVGTNYADTHQPVCDTVILEPDERRLLLVWRTSHPLKRNLFEVDQVVVGHMSPGWYRARSANKVYYPSLADFVRSEQEAS